MKHIFNAHALVSVKIVDRKENHHWDWIPFKKGFWCNRKEGFYELYYHPLGGRTPHSEEELIKEYDHLLIIDKKVYYKPYAKLTFTNGQTYTKEFNTYEEALTWGREQANTGIQVRLEF